MIVTVVGSFQPRRGHEGEGPQAEDRSAFEQACRAIGIALGERGHRLIVAHRFDNLGNRAASAEAHALEGFRSTANKDNFEQVPHHAGDPQLKAHTEAVERSDAVILLGGKEGTYAAGLSALLRRKMIITVPAFGGSAGDLCEIDEINDRVVDALRNLDVRGDPAWLDTLTNAIIAEIDSYPRVLIIHGRGDDGRRLSDAISNAGREDPLKGLSQPVIMDLSGKGAVSVPEVFEKFASQVSATIAIVTADDIGGFARRDVPEERAGKTWPGARNDESSLPPLPATELKLGPRARENVWVEVGWFWGRLGRKRIFLWLEDEVPLPSDLQGAAWSMGSFEKAWPQIRDFLVNLRHPQGDFRQRHGNGLLRSGTRAASQA